MNRSASIRRLAVLVMASWILAPASAALAAGGKPQLQSYFQATGTSPEYQKKTFARVAKAWKQPRQTPQVGKKTVVQAVIGRDGKLASAVVSLESGSKAWDAAALAAVEKAAPFDSLPASYPFPTVEVHFHVSWEAR